VGHTRPRALTVNNGSLDVREQHVCISTSSRAAPYRSSKPLISLYGRRFWVGKSGVAAVR